MSAKPENTFRASVHKYLPLHLHHEKMANPYSSGTADDWYSGNKADLWVEYKFLPKTPQTASLWLINPNVKKPDLSVLQQQWLRGRYAEGRNVVVIVGCPDGGIILQDQEWEQRIDADSFRKRLIPRKAIAQWIADTTTR